MKRLYFKADSEVVTEGDFGDCAYIVESGRLEVSKANKQNNKQVLGQLKENDIFGELGLIDGLPRSATVTTLENCTIKVLTKDSFNSLAKNKPEALMPIFKVLASRLRSTLKQVANVSNQVKL
jgi:CRP-like cAMP-binding protein